MPTTLDWVEIARRLAFTVAAGAVIGINRGERGRPAGLRTILLVAVAASVAMIEANLLLAARIRTGEALAQFDVMRLPLGVLSGIGFIGAGAILRRSHLLIGVTTAATLWFVTIMGLCFGAGQAGLGLPAFAIAAIVLWCLPWFERRMRH